MGDARRQSATTRRQRALELALQGAGSREIAAELGVSQRQAQRLLAAVRDDLDAARMQQLQHIRAACANAAAAAVQTLKAVMEDPSTPAAVKVQAAVAVLSQLRNYHDAVVADTAIQDLKQRVALLEERLKGRSVWRAGASSNGKSTNWKILPPKSRR